MARGKSLKRQTSVLRAARLAPQQRTSSFTSFRNKKYESKLSISYFFNL